MERVELLAPAGDMDKLKTALHFGADAVYIGGSCFSLRANAKNFDKEQLKEAVEYTHERGKKIYVAANVFAFNSDFPALEEYFRMLESTGVDAVIISDAGVLALCRQVAPNLEIHLSTQANTTNKYAAKFWAEQGVKRVVLARETSMSDIKEIRDYLPADVEIEAFVHGAMCIAYSGRCLLSNALTGRSSNRGDCVQACRWNYELREKGSGTRELFCSIMQQQGLRVEETWVCNNSQAILNAVALGQGLTVISRLLARGWLQNKRVCEVKVRGYTFGRWFHLVYHKNKFISQTLGDFIELARDKQKIAQMLA